MHTTGSCPAGQTTFKHEGIFTAMGIRTGNKRNCGSALQYRCNPQTQFTPMIAYFQTQ